MGNPDDLLYEYAIVRYVPRVDREEFINIGLIMMCKRRKWLNGKIELNSERISAFDPFARLKSLESQTSVFSREDVPFADIPVEEKYRWLTAVKSAVIQVSPSHPGILMSAIEETEVEPKVLLQREFDRLFEELVTI